MWMREYTESVGLRLRVLLNYERGGWGVWGKARFE